MFSLCENNLKDKFMSNYKIQGKFIGSIEYDGKKQYIEENNNFLKISNKIFNKILMSNPYTINENYKANMIILGRNDKNFSNMEYSITNMRTNDNSGIITVSLRNVYTEENSIDYKLEILSSTIGRLTDLTNNVITTITLSETLGIDNILNDYLKIVISKDITVGDYWLFTLSPIFISNPSIPGYVSDVNNNLRYLEFDVEPILASDDTAKITFSYVNTSGKEFQAKELSLASAFSTNSTLVEADNEDLSTDTIISHLITRMSFNYRIPHNATLTGDYYIRLNTIN